MTIAADSVYLGRKRVILVDTNDQWRLRVSLDLVNGRLTIESGNGDYDGFDGNLDPVTHEVSGVGAGDRGHFIVFARFVIDNFVGDERIMDCVNHLLACQS
jgi:hypothetical protein